MVLKHIHYHYQLFWVLDPYKLTWFSNLIDEIDIAKKVLDPYKLTWFSN